MRLLLYTKTSMHLLNHNLKKEHYVFESHKKFFVIFDIVWKQSTLPITITSNQQVALLFAASVAIHVTSVAPIGNLLPDEG